MSIIQWWQYDILICFGRNRSLSSRATSLEITFYDSSDSHQGSNVMQPKSLSWLKQFLRSTVDQMIGRKPKPIPPAVKLAQLAKHVLPRLTRVTELSFVYQQASNYSERTCDVETLGFIVLPGVLKIVGLRLQTLHIESPFVVHLPPRLESLESFSLDASDPSHTPEIHLKNFRYFFWRKSLPYTEWHLVLLITLWTSRLSFYACHLCLPLRQ